jgi:hypothetical protein
VRCNWAAALISFAACQPAFEEFHTSEERDGGVRDKGGGDDDAGDGGFPEEPADAEPARVGWSAETLDGPEGRDRHVIVYSPKTRAVILAGGGRAAPGDMWMWLGSTWQRLPDPPFQRKVDAAAAEDANGDIVLFGGRFETGADRTNETWTWDGANWTQRFPPNSPPLRIFSAMAYDRSRGKSVLFGGIGASDQDVLGDTWEWDGNNWTELHPPNSPSPRGYSAMTYDTEHERVVLFGGGTSEHADGTRYDDLYYWDGDNWEEIIPLFQGPSARCDHAMAYDLGRRAVVIFSGSDYFPFKRDTWELRNGRWSQIVDGVEPVGVSNARMDYDRAGHGLVMFGGWNNGGHERTTYLFGPID